jgi:hypothetical protein
MTFSIGTLTVDYSVAMLEDFPASGIADGQYVEVKSMQMVSNNIIVASEIEMEGDEGNHYDGEDGDELELEGVVMSNFMDNQFMLNSQIVIVNDTTEYENGSAANISAGAKMEVEGMLNSDGHLMAKHIEFRVESDIEISAPVEAVDADNNTITVLGQTVLVDTLTRMNDDRHDLAVMAERYFDISDIAVGDWVEIDAYNSESGLVATELERTDASEDSKVEVEGVITDITDTGLLVVGNVVHVDVSSFSDVFELGQEIEVEGDFIEGVIIATEISVDDEDD